ncbi:MAG TPA: DUF1614 domain-containing protein [Candidatus Tectomicrobia bacterium]
MFFHPLVLFMMMILVVGVIVLFFVVQIGIISYAFDKIGIPSEALFSLLLLSWVGSWINIPLVRFPAEDSVMEEVVVRVFGQRYVMPQWSQPRQTVLAVNVGGAVVPTLLSLYLLTQALAPLRVVVATAAVTLLTYWWARPVAGVGIVVPMLLPPLSAALAALLLVPQQAPLAAYVAGTMGTLIGADVLHVRQVTKLATPVASIGGAGTFDGVFLTGIIAVLLA